MKNQQYLLMQNKLKHDLRKQDSLKPSMSLAINAKFLNSQQLKRPDSERSAKNNTINKLIFFMMFSGFAFLFNPAYADPPRVLTTSFEDYARQQAQVDKNLSSANTTSNQASFKLSTKPSVSTSSPKNTSKSSAKQKNTTPININLADEASLSNTLIGVGPSKAKAIIDYRQKNGKFKQPEDLLAVKGIGPATLEKNRARIRVN